MRRDLNWVFFFFIDPATTEIYTLSYTTLFRSGVPLRALGCIGDALLADTELYDALWRDRKSTRLNSSHITTSYAVFCLKKKTNEPRFPLTQPRTSTP